MFIALTIYNAGLYGNSPSSNSILLHLRLCNYDPKALQGRGIPDFIALTTFFYRGRHLQSEPVVPPSMLKLFVLRLLETSVLDFTYSAIGYCF